MTERRWPPVLGGYGPAATGDGRRTSAVADAASTVASPSRWALLANTGPPEEHPLPRPEPCHTNQ